MPVQRLAQLVAPQAKGAHVMSLSTQAPLSQTFAFSMPPEQVDGPQSIGVPTQVSWSLQVSPVVQTLSSSQGSPMRVQPRPPSGSAETQTSPSVGPAERA